MSETHRASASFASAAVDCAAAPPPRPQLVDSVAPLVATGGVVAVSNRLEQLADSSVATGGVVAVSDLLEQLAGSSVATGGVVPVSDRLVQVLFSLWDLDLVFAAHAVRFN
jgi:hypothetical protein